MKRIIGYTLVITLVVSLMACTGGNSTPTSLAATTVATNNAASLATTQETTDNMNGNSSNQTQSNELKISDLEFILDDGIFESDRRNASFQFKNNSEYEIFYLELMMKLKDEIVIADEYKAAYDEIVEMGNEVFVRVYFNEYWDNYLEDTNSMWANDILSPVKSGETSGKVMVQRNNVYYIEDSSELENFEFEEVTVRYFIDEGENEKTLIYNYAEDKHIYGEAKPAKEAVALPTPEPEKELSEDDTPISVDEDVAIFSEVTADNELEFWYTNNSEYTITDFSIYYHIDKEYFPEEAQDDIFLSETFSFQCNDSVKPGETSNHRLMSEFLNNAETLKKLDKNNFKYASMSEVSMWYIDGEKTYHLMYSNNVYTLREV